MLTKKQKETILKYVLQNAVFYKGEASEKAVLSKVMPDTEFRKLVNEVKIEIKKTVKEINSLKLDEQKKMLEKISPEMLKKEVKKQSGLPPLKEAKEGEVVTRFAVAPTGPLHISHILRAVFLDYLYAKKYKGKFILRFDDTDPKNTKKEYYQWIKEDLVNSGVKWDKIVTASDSLELYYKCTIQLLNNGNAYVCTCSSENFRELKLKKRICICRRNNSKENLDRWKKMLSGGYKKGNAVVRLKTSMKNPNPVLRDPPLLRIIDHEHPLKGKKYRVWPLYNYSCTIEDYKEGITHVFRAKEHEHNTAVQKEIYKIMKWKMPKVVNFGMLYVPGKKLHTRDIKSLIEKGEMAWNDVRLNTVRTLLRRGFQSATFKEFAVYCGLSKTDILLDFENMAGINRKIIDPIANRFMVVVNPVKIEIKNLPDFKKVRLNKHPDFEERGEKEVPVNKKEIYISEQDFENLKNKEIRLIGLGNIKLTGRISIYTNNEISKKIQKIQWVSEPNVKIKILKPEETLTGIGEPEMKKLKTGDIIQMERIGFGKIDSKDNKEIVICFAHK